MRAIQPPTLRDRLPGVIALALATLLAPSARAAAPGITAAPASAGAGTFNLSATAAHLSQPDGASIYSWGYGCTGGTATRYHFASRLTGTNFSPTPSAKAACPRTNTGTSAPSARPISASTS